MTRGRPWRVDHSIMINVTWRRFDQSAKQLIVGHTTNLDVGLTTVHHPYNVFWHLIDEVLLTLCRPWSLLWVIGAGSASHLNHHCGHPRLFQLLTTDFAPLQHLAVHCYLVLSAPLCFCDILGECRTLQHVYTVSVRLVRPNKFL